MNVFVARQAIFDRAGQLHGYELLFRSGDLPNQFDGTDSASATTQVMANSLLSIGLENILCGKKAFFNFDRDLLLGGIHAILPPEKVVLEILESVEPDAELIAACRDLHQQGYTIALDDFVGQPQLEPLADIAQLIKVDLRKTTQAEQEHLLRAYQPRGITMLAEKVETPQEFEWARRAGYDLFQGYFFARPQIVRGKQIPSTKINCLRLLRETQNADLDFPGLEQMISEDLSLSYKLLRYVNSALFARRSEISSIKHSLAVLGETGVRHWAALAALPEMAKDKPGELITHSLVRARFAERLAELAGGAESHLGFLMGLFSLLDALLDVSLDEALRRAGVGPLITEPLLGTAQKDSLYGNVYQLVCRYEAADWKGVAAVASQLGLKASDVGQAYSESTLWAQQALHATARKTDSRLAVRYSAEGVLRILWLDQAGCERTSSAKLVNVSATGLQLLIKDNIPVHASVSCNDPKIGIAGTGSVRYCKFSKGEYLVGLAFSNGTGWHEPA